MEIEIKRCREEPCEGDDDEHVTTDITELIRDSQEAYTTWRYGTNLKLTVMKNKVWVCQIDCHSECLYMYITL